MNSIDALPPIPQLSPSTTSFSPLFSEADLDTALNRAEESMRRIAGHCRLQKTAHPDVFCSVLPTHWRSNKSLPTPFVVLALFPVPDGCRVSVSAGNDENWLGEVKNGQAEMCAQMARFSDLRFVGKSGRGKNFNLTITLHTHPLAQVVVVPNLVKVTVDGPRDSRNASKYLNGQYVPRKLRSNLDPHAHQMAQFAKKTQQPREAAKPGTAPFPSALVSIPRPSTALLPPFPPLPFPMSPAMPQTLSLTMHNGNGALRQMNGANGTNLLAAKLAIGTMHSLNDKGIPGSPISSSAFRPISSQSASVAGIFDPFMAQMITTTPPNNPAALLRLAHPFFPAVGPAGLLAAAAMFAPSMNGSPASPLAPSAPPPSVSLLAAAMNAAIAHQLQQQRQQGMATKMELAAESGRSSGDQQQCQLISPTGGTNDGRIHSEARIRDNKRKRHSLSCSSSTSPASPPADEDEGPASKRQKCQNDDNEDGRKVEEEKESKLTNSAEQEDTTGQTQLKVDPHSDPGGGVPAANSPAGAALWRPFHA